MNPLRIDRINRLFAERRSHAAARENAPEAVPATWKKTPYLFVQSFQGGSLTANPDTGTHTLTLEQGLGQTVYFSDRPGRDVGITPTSQFLGALGFPARNPPNAALIVDRGDGETDLAVLELFDPSYDESTQTATYQVRGLEAWEDSLALGLQDVPADLSTLAADLRASHLFIDDCTDDTVECGYINDRGVWQVMGSFPGQGFCYNFALCIPCEPYGHNNPDRCSVGHYWQQKCNDTFTTCLGSCKPLWPTRDWLCSDWL